MGGDVSEGPLNILVGGQVPGECRRLHAAHPQDAVICRQRGPVRHDHLLVFVVGSNRFTLFCNINILQTLLNMHIITFNRHHFCHAVRVS